MPVLRTGGNHVNTASDHLDLLEQVVAFITTPNAVTAPDGSGNTGGGTMSQPTADDDAPTETITATCTLGGGAGVATFDVEGTESGPLGSNTAGDPFNNVVQFSITASGADFIIGDEFSFDVEQLMGAEAWEELDNTTGGGAGDFSSDGEVYLKAPNEAIHVNVRTASSVPGDRYNWEIQGATGYNAGLTFDEQPGAIPAAQGVPHALLWASPINFVLVADSRRFVVVAYAAGQPTESVFAGWFEAFGPPELYPAPMFVGGCHWDATKNAAVVEDEHVWWADDFESATGRKSAAHCRTPGGGWARLRQARSNTDFDDAEDRCAVHPTTFLLSTTRIAPGYGSGGSNSYALLQATLHLHSTPFETANRQGDCAMVGQLTGVFWTTGLGLTTGDTLTKDSIDYFVFNDTKRTDIVNFLALRLT